MGPISSPLTAAAAHTQVMSVRELEAMFSSTASPARDRRWRSAATWRWSSCMDWAYSAAMALAWYSRSSRANARTIAPSCARSAYCWESLCEGP